MEFSRQEYWSGWSFLSLGNLPNSGIEPRSHTLQADSLSSGPITTFYCLTQISISSLEAVLWPLKHIDPMAFFLGIYAGASHRPHLKLVGILLQLAALPVGPSGEGPSPPSHPLETWRPRVTKESVSFLTHPANQTPRPADTPGHIAQIPHFFSVLEVTGLI